jgi:hypothetical protein
VKLSKSRRMAAPWTGGLGAHGSNPCTPTNKEARNRGLFYFLGVST